MYKNPKFLLATVLLVISSVLHLVQLDRPHSVVFDEVHFGKFINSYCCDGKRFFDIHPPHAKLLIAGAVKIAGYDGSFDFNEIGNDYAETPVYALRIVPAISGILLSLLFFILLMQFEASTGTAFLGALFLTLDNALLVQTRIVAIDGILLSAMMGSLSLYIAARKTTTAPEQAMLFILCGCAAGMAVGTKFTGLTALTLPGAVAALMVLSKRNKATCFLESRYLFLILAGAAAIYLIGWYIHFYLLNVQGSGDKFYKPEGHFWTDLFKLHSIMFHSNYFLDQPHPYSSKWWSWPIMTRPIFYWVGDKAAIYFLGNPVVWIGGTLTFIILMIRATPDSFCVKGSSIETSITSLVPVIGFFISYLPYIFIPRILFMYHYLPPLVFSLAFTVVNFEKKGWVKKGRAGQQDWFYWSLILLLTVGFFFISPLTFGWKYPDWYEYIIFSLFSR